MLKLHIRDCFKINGKQIQKNEYVKFKNFKKYIKSPFMIDADFEGILVPEVF